MVDYTVFESRY